MEKNGSLEAGKTPCTKCGEKSTHILGSGDATCGNCAREKIAASSGSTDTMDKAIAAHSEGKSCRKD